LRRDACIGKRRVFSNKSNFVQPNSARSALSQVRLEALGKSATLRTRLHERAHKMRELVAGNTAAKANACNVCICEHVGETAFGRRRFERNAVQKKLRSGGA
jgi:hypothetical protein